MIKLSEYVNILIESKLSYINYNAADENNINEMIWSCIHEGGHALYEQGLNSDDYGLPTSEFISLGIHESQSRLWENNVGRSLAYWKANYPKMQSVFPDNLANVAGRGRVYPSG